jgi:hypothetical protein
MGAARKHRMFSIWKWASRLLLLLALSVLCATMVSVWPDGRDLDPMEFAAIAILLVATGGVALWTMGVWIGEPRGPSHERAGAKERNKSGDSDLLF